MDEVALAFAGVSGQAEALRKGDVSVKELVETCLRRIDRLDPQLNAFRIVYREQALERAKSAQRKMRAKNPPPLLGVPVAIKDNTDVAGDVTTHGTQAYGAPATADAEVVRRVREAGAIVIGRTNVPPLCAMCATESTAFGFTRNPWDPTRTPGGSSGGSAAAVASGMVAAALATDGAGSIRIPAAFCGLFGLKPQRGRVSLAPFAEHWYGLSVAGWLTRSVADQALMLDLTMGPTEVDADRPPAPVRSFSEAAASKPKALRIAYSLKVPPGLLGVHIHDEVRAGVLETVELLRSLGHEISEHDPDYGPVTFGSTALRMLRGSADEARTLPNFDRLERRFKNWTRLGSLISDRAIAWSRKTGDDARARLAASTFESFDALITPVSSVPAIETGRWEGRGAIWTLNGMSGVVPWPGIWNATGQPAASVPAGFTARGLPRATMLVGRSNDEDTLISLAAQLEAERGLLDERPPIS
jgi:amidase